MQLKKVGTTVVISRFGKIQLLDGPRRLEDFTKAYDKLVPILARRTDVTLLVPSAFEWSVEETSFDAYTLAIEELATRRNILFVRDLAGKVKPSDQLVATVREKHRLWYEYWRPANWKCLFGDDSRRVFSNASRGLPSFKQEWTTYPGLIEKAEARIFADQPTITRKSSELTGFKGIDVETEMKSFQVLDGFDINLFDDELLGVELPLPIRCDADGNAYVASSDALPNDKLILLRNPRW